MPILEENAKTNISIPSHEEKRAPVFKAAKDHLTFLLGEKCLKGLWKNIWPDLSKGGNTGHYVDMNEIVEEMGKLEKQKSLDEVNVDDVKEIVQETAASLSIDKLKELMD
ncbi:hypothetical protein TNCV_2029751 [Trichonephila clavipes]|nr:hypothetical protein TNCV_2029751 [Trichonephila clavipes]